MRTMYDENKTTKLLGKQYINSMIDEESFEGLRDILAAQLKHREVLNSMNVLVDAFMYGYIMGKRAERKKKRAKLERMRKEIIDIMTALPEESLDKVVEQMETGSFRKGA